MKDDNLLVGILKRLPPEERARAAADWERILTAYLTGGEAAAKAAARRALVVQKRRRDDKVTR